MAPKKSLHGKRMESQASDCTIKKIKENKKKSELAFTRSCVAIFPLRICFSFFLTAARDKSGLEWLRVIVYCTILNT